MRFTKASQAEHAFDRPARPDRHHAVFGRLIAAYKAHVPDRLRRADTAGIGGDLRPPAAVLGLGEDQAVTVRGRSDVQGRAGFRESLGEFTGELARCHQQRRHHFKPAGWFWLLLSLRVVQWLLRRARTAGSPFATAHIQSVTRLRL